MGKKVLIASLIGNIFFVTLFTVFIVKRGGVEYVEEKLLPDSTEASNLKLKYINIFEKNIQRVTLFDVLPIYQDDIIFIGNSITNGCEWAELFNNNKIKDRSIPGDNSSGVLNRIDQVSKFRPKKIFLMIGVNDLINSIKIDSIAKNYLNIVKRIKSSSPKTKVYIQSVLPVNDDLGYTNNDDVIALNSRTKNIAADNNITYIDIFSYLLDSSGKLSREYSNDGLHLLGNGYLIWKNIIKPYVN